MSIDPSKPVQLTKIANIGADFYFPRTYKPGELPDILMQEAYVTQVESEPVVVTSSFETKQVEFASSEPIVKGKSYPVETVTIEKMVEQASTKVNVNTADIDALSGLPSVGPSAASKVIAARAQKPFADIKDLSDRVPLSRGKWEDLQDKLEF